MDKEFSVSQILAEARDRTDRALKANVTVEERETIPPLDGIKVELPRWYRVDPVVAVVADLKNSTQFNTRRQQKTIARFYEGYMSSLVSVVQAFKPEFVDIQGDGLFALFDGQDALQVGMVAAVSVKLFSDQVLLPRLRNALVDLPDTGVKVGVASGAILVKKVGVRGTNEPIWAGKPVNWAAKCAQVADAGQLVVTRGVWEQIEGNEYLRWPCDHQSRLLQRSLWRSITVEKLPEGQRECHAAMSFWCDACTDSFCRAVLAGESNRPKAWRIRLA